MIKKQYPHGVIYNGNCFDILPTLEQKTAEIAITSPPYNLNKSCGSGGSTGMEKRYKNWYPDEVNEYAYIGQQKHLIYLLSRICKSSIFYNHRIRYAWHPRNKIQPASKMFHPYEIVKDFPVWCDITWNRKAIGNPIKNRFYTQTEKIYQLYRPKYFNNDKKYSDLWTINPSKTPEHPCSFPEEIPKRCIETTTKVNDVVLDPYMGLGTSIISAVKNNRNFIGIEKDKKYFDIAVQKLDYFYKQLQLDFNVGNQ